MALDFFIDQGLDYADFRHRQKHGLEIPAEIEGKVDRATLEKTVAYENTNYKFSIPETLVTLALNLFLLISGFYPAVYHALFSRIENSLLVDFLFLVIIGIPGSIISIPFDLYDQFKIEEKFGFNKMTLKLWLVDQVKSFAISLVISLPLVFAIGFFLERASSLWWLWVSILVVAFTFAISTLFPMVIAPLFNKFTPLEDGELKSRLTAELEEAGFKASGLFVMDASKRSGHSNAYFTGFGKSKRVVLYDTLIEQLTPEEIEAVLGHELGHYKHHHIVKKMIFIIPIIFVFFFLLSLLINSFDLYLGFGFAPKENFELLLPKMRFIGLFLLNLTFGSFTILLNPIMNYFSRRDEFQADAFAAKICGSGEPLSTALIKLNKENLSELTVPKIYSVFNYSHPPLLERIAAIKDCE